MEAVKVAYKRTPDRRDYIKLGDESDEIDDLICDARDLIAHS